MGTIDSPKTANIAHPSLDGPFEWLEERPETPVLKQLRDLKREKETKRERVWRVQGARALLVNYGLIQHDFPFMREEALMLRHPRLRSLGSAERLKAIHQLIDEWLVDQTAFISEAQCAQTEVNSPIPVGQDDTIAYRPPEYGRALVFSLQENARARGRRSAQHGLLDVKGTGVAPGKTPTLRDHSNGLLELGTAIMEIIYQQLIEKVFRHAGGVFSTLPNYGVIDLGIQVHFPNGLKVPAGLLVRRAHVRQWNAGGFPSSPLEEAYMMEVELLLRKYGITSTCNGTTYTVWEKDNTVFAINNLQRTLTQMNPAVATQLRDLFAVGAQPMSIQSTNVQLTRDLRRQYPKTTLVDFTHYNVIEDCLNPVYTPDSEAPLYLGKFVRKPGDTGYVRPDPRCQIPYALTGERGVLWDLPVEKHASMDRKSRALCFSLATEFQKNAMTRQEVSAYMGAYMRLITQHLQ